MNQHNAVATDHRTRILNAAQSCFVRSGFHRATVQDVAAEAGMSAGNIYRYFSSKSAIIAGLCARDRADLASSFATLQSATEPFAMFMAIGRKHLVDEPREKAVFVLDLWAEAARNEEIAAVCRDFETDINGWMAGFMKHLIAQGQADPRLDPIAVTQLVLCMSDGLLSRRAREPDTDAALQLDHIGHVLRLACAGQIPSLFHVDAAMTADVA
ncbi:MAG: TetR/AcrR family transcriptional regulator [Bosea sp. (in: a-proteobacteria)]